MIQQLLNEFSDTIVVMDGGMGSTLADRGFNVRTALWGSGCFLDPQATQTNDQIHADFVRAGAQILITNTHNVRRSKCDAILDQLEASELPDHVAALSPSERSPALHQWLHEQAVTSARRAIPTGSRIAIASCLGSIEPAGAYAEESQITAQEACQRLKTEFLVRSASDVDLIICETMTTRSEIEGLALLGREMDLGDFAVGFACGPGARTLGGVPITEAVSILEPVKPLVYFVQCTRYDYVLIALQELVSTLGPNRLTGVYANDGRIWKNQKWHGERIGPEQYAELARIWNEAGARIIGGCCGIDESHIAQLTQTFNPH